jgi:Uma2 family endonuclease
MAAPAYAQSGAITAGEFLKFLKFRPNEERWQLIEGVAKMMTPPTYVHQVIAFNLNYLLLGALERKGLNLLAVSDAGVRLRSVSDFLPRPDVVVVPGIAEYRSYAERFLLVAEVLSPSNTKSLIARKLRFYKSHPNNLYCLVIDSRRTWIEVHARANAWKPFSLERPSEVFELPEFGLRCTLGDLYRRTPLDPAKSTGKGRPRSR